jgi:cellobiose phosphorylase
VLALLVEHVLGVRPRTDGLHVAPRLLPGLDHASARLRVGAGMLTLHVRREAAGAPSARARIGGKLVAERAAGEIDLTGTAHLGDDIDVDIVLPRE